MNKSKMTHLTKYLGQLKDKLSNPKVHPKRGTLSTYTQFLKNEIGDVEEQLAAHKLDSAGK